MCAEYIIIAFGVSMHAFEIQNVCCSGGYGESVFYREKTSNLFHEDKFFYCNHD